MRQPDPNEAASDLRDHVRERVGPRELSAQREARRDEAITVVAGGQRIAAVTREHPMYDGERRTYVHVGALTLRATLLAYTDGAARPAALTALLRRAQDVDVYDLSVEGSDPNFFAEGLLAHNKVPDASWDANYGDSALVDAAPQDGEVEDGAPPDAAAQDADAPDANDSGS